jgi:hypothetical protein
MNIFKETIDFELSQNHSKKNLNLILNFQTFTSILNLFSLNLKFWTKYQVHVLEKGF